MKKILVLFSMIFLLNGCAESLALLGTSASNGKIFNLLLIQQLVMELKNKQEKLL